MPSPNVASGQRRLALCVECQRRERPLARDASMRNKKAEICYGLSVPVLTVFHAKQQATRSLTGIYSTNRTAAPWAQNTNSVKVTHLGKVGQPRSGAATMPVANQGAKCLAC